LPSWKTIAARIDPRVDAVDVSGAPPQLVGAIESFLKGGLSVKAGEITARFPAVRQASVRRDWLKRRVVVNVVMRRALSRVTRAGQPAGWIDEDGMVFSAPDGIYSEAGPAVEIGAAQADGRQLSALARALPSLASGEGLPASVEAVRFRSSYDGWELVLRDGTSVLWGRMDWTPEKMRRLSEALADAKSRLALKDGGSWTADLRYFEDGRVLLRPGRRL
jgi:cell division septal protein FtsQ